MLLNHENLLSTFGKDSESSNRKHKQSAITAKSKRVCLNYDAEPKSRYQQILNQRKTLIMVEKKQPTKFYHEQKKKLKTQSDIEVLNSKIRKSISGIAQTICKSKISSSLNNNYKECTYEPRMSSTKKINAQSNVSKIQSLRQLRTFQSKRLESKRLRSSRILQKENINLMNEMTSLNGRVQSNKNIGIKEYTKNSTKKKAKFFQSHNNNQYPIKSSFSIDMNSEHDSIFKSSRKNFGQKLCSRFDATGMSSLKQPRLSSKNRESLNKVKKVNFSIGRENEDTLKKQFRQLVESNYIEQPKLLQTKNYQRQKIKSHHTMSEKQRMNRQFLFYSEAIQQQQEDEDIKSPNFNSIQVPQKLNLFEVKKKVNLLSEAMCGKQQQYTHHPLIGTLINQIELDYDLRHAKHMFSGIEEPFSTRNTLRDKQSKWERLNKELNSRGLYYSVETIKRIFLPSEQELDPFLSVTKPHDELIHSLIYAYETAEINWEQKVFKKWQHWDLRDIDLTIENIDRDRKGYITVQDLAAFISMQAGKEYKNRDVILIYKRLVNGFNTKAQDTSRDPINIWQKNKLKFRSLIDCLIKNF